MHTQMEKLLTNLFYAGTQGLVFVIDSSDRDRLDEARTELARIIQDREMKDALLLVFANKQDIPGGKLPYSSVIVLKTDKSILSNASRRALQTPETRRHCQEPHMEGGT
jgi:signal recognition particle receptor subunit beta